MTKRTMKSVLGTLLAALWLLTGCSDETTVATVTNPESEETESEVKPEWAWMEEAFEAESPCVPA